MYYVFNFICRDLVPFLMTVFICSVVCLGNKVQESSIYHSVHLLFTLHDSCNNSFCCCCQVLWGLLTYWMKSLISWFDKIFHLTGKCLVKNACECNVKSQVLVADLLQCLVNQDHCRESCGVCARSTYSDSGPCQTEEHALVLSSW